MSQTAVTLDVDPIARVRKDKMKLVLCVMLSFWLCSLFAAATFGAEPSTAPSTEAQVAAYLGEQDFGKSSAILRAWKTAGPDQKIALMEELEKSLGSTKAIPLTNTADMMVWSRPSQGNFDGHGLILKQDVYVVGGKAAWAMEFVLDLQLPPILEKMAEEDKSRSIAQIKATVSAYEKGVADARNSKTQ